MEAARVPRIALRPPAVNAGLIAALLGLAAVAWIVTDARMGDMDAGPGTPVGGIGFFVGIWVVMMAAMMFPSVAPLVFMYGRVQARKGGGAGASAVGTAALLGGYLLSWALAGLAAYGIFEGVRSLGIDALAWDRAGPYVAGGVIAAAAAYQLTSLKDACLRRCRSPLMFLLHSWRPGATGALRMGVEHGAWCVGCCWALMAALFALGVMSLGWMAVVAALIATEKLLRWKAVANRGIAILLIALGVAVAFAPEHVPGLTIPGSPEAMEAMEMEAMGTGDAPPAPAHEAMPGMEAQPVAPGSGPMPGMDE